MLITITPNPVLDKTITVEEVIFNEMARATAIREDWGGKGFNVSRVLQAMGLQSLAMGFSGGATGYKLAQGLAELGIQTDLVPIAGETRTNIIITETKQNRFIKVNEPGPVLQPDELATLLDRVRQRTKPGDLCALCGSLPPGVPEDFYAQLITTLQACGALAFLDASGAPLELGLTARPYLIKPNHLEAQALTGQTLTTPEDAQKAALCLHQSGARLVALSMGAQGMFLAYPSTSHYVILHVVPPQVVVRQPTGAGDALLAGLLFALSQEMPFREAARWGVASGTAAAMRPGVSTGTYAEIKALFQACHITAEWSYDA